MYFPRISTVLLGKQALKLNYLHVEYDRILRLFYLYHQVSYLMMFMLHQSLRWKDFAKV